MASSLVTEVVVVGAGPAGLTAALALCTVGTEVVIAAPAYDPARAEADRRTTALLPSSIELLKNLGVWQGCENRRAALAVAADGRASIARTAAAIGTRSWSYAQTAIAATFCHSRPHAGVTTELHRRAGPLTTVPLPGDASSLVWVEEPALAAHLAALDDAAFLAELAARLQGLLGSLRNVSPRAVHSLSGLGALRMGQSRVALVGESAHVIPPIGAQGLNLGLRDAAALAECVGAARARREDIGSAATLATYHAARAADVLGRTPSLDLLKSSP